MKFILIRHLRQLALCLIDLVNQMIHQRIPSPYISTVRTIIAEKSNQFLRDGNLIKIIHDEFANHLLTGKIRPACLLADL